MNEILDQREQLSALADGQLQGEEMAHALQFAHSADGLATWELYHVVGDVLRSPELARHAGNADFLNRLQQQLAREPQPLRPLLVHAGLQQIAEPSAAMPEAANASVFRWKMAAGLASMAVVLAVGWNSWDTLQNGGPSGARLAAAPPAPEQAAVAVAENQAPQVMLRDPRLDELLAAHKQFGGTSALQMPAGFLRNATFEAPAR
ncbi:anti-anti-sigma factor [Acidovorax sp. SRB_14]|uniref:sigma-E factor negative regulatory protein n=1 Tax=Acidovorax sp. SRB_14 TaxID=1962699 RepID=UPI001562ED61|nr:sigma-E factor negative regulatory protein [Acidovorax sp. SRB_14]NMM80484.1 anti-anti-sigma factor [Acidovorax sp. SRB_14]